MTTVARWVRSAAWAYLAGLALWIATFLFLGDATWWLFLINSMAHLAFLGLALALMCAVAVGGTALRLAVVGMMAVGWWVVGPAWPPDTDEVGVQPALSVVTWNLHIENDRPDRVVGLLADLDADLVALQELAPPVARALEIHLADMYPYRILFPSEQWQGMGVVSKYPLQWNDERIPDTSYRNPLFVEADVPGGPTTVIVVHYLSTPRYLDAVPGRIISAIENRGRLTDALVEKAKTRDRPVLLLGDFNVTPRNDPYRTLAGTFEDAWAAAGRGFGFTYPGGPRRPSPFGVRIPFWFLRIDYVFATDGWRATQARVGPWDGNSDHRPLIVDYVRRAERSAPEERPNVSRSAATP